MMLRLIFAFALVAVVAGSGWVAYEYFQQKDGVTVNRSETEKSPPGKSTMPSVLRLLAESKKAFAGVKDYKCLYLRDEYFENEKEPGKYIEQKNVMELRVRHEPFTLLMAWKSDDILKAGRKLVYPSNGKPDKMFVHMPGLLGRLAGEKDLDEGVKRKETRHTPDKAGIKNMLDRFEESWQKELPHTQVEIQEVEFKLSVDGKEYRLDCLRVTTLHPPAHKEAYDNAGFRFYKTQLYLDYTDKKIGFPVQMKGYFWPKSTPASSTAAPTQVPLQLMENFVYLDVKTNLGLKDEDFDPKR